MGWCNDDGTHEGFLVGLVPDEDRGLFVGHILELTNRLVRDGQGRVAQPDEEDAG